MSVHRVLRQLRALAKATVRLTAHVDTEFFRGLCSSEHHLHNRQVLTAVRKRLCEFTYELNRPITQTRLEDIALEVTQALGFLQSGATTKTLKSL